MKKIILKTLFILIFILTFIPVAYSSLFYFQGYDSETLTVTNGAVVQCTDAKLHSSGGNKTNRAYFTVESNDIRILYNEGVAGAPTTSVGIKIEAGKSFEIVGYENINSLGMIGISGTATVSVQYETIRKLR